MGIAILCASLVLSALLLYKGYVAFGRSRRISDLPTTPMIDLRDGLVEVKGTISTRSSAIESPMTGTSCVLYHFVVEEERRSGQNGTRWVNLISDTTHTTCVIEDDSGACELELGKAHLDLIEDHHASSGTFRAAGTHLDAVLRRYGQTTKGIVFNKKLRYTETILKEGDFLYALGECGLRDGDIPLIDKGKDQFLVSDQSERELLTKFRLRTASYSLGALASVALGIYVAVAA